MNPTAALRVQRACIARRSIYVPRRTTQWRSYSSAVSDDTLPLKGIRVLDMTRVLAGVSSRLVVSNSAGLEM